MAYRSRRTGFGIGRGGALALVAGAAILIGALWLGPLRPLPPELRLLALSPAGEFVADVATVAQRGDTVALAADAVARAPLVLAVQNVGARATRPSVLRVSVPGRFRLTGRDGDPLPSRTAVGTPLTQYEFELDFPTLRPSAMPAMLPGLDTLWLEVVLPQYHCDLIADAVPEFIPSPPYDPGTLSTVRLFYAFDGPTAERQTGLLTVRIDPALLVRESAPPPQRSPVTMHTESAPRPELGPLRQIGTRTAQCGDPGAAIELHTVLWEGEAGGWLYEVYVSDAPRKLLYDINRDGLVDLEIWDTEGDGSFRARREASYAVPQLIQPLPQRLARAEQVDSLWLARFRSVQEGPYRFAQQQPRLAGAQPARAPVVAQPVDSAWLARFRAAAAGPFRFSDVPPPFVTQPVDSVWLAHFHDAGAGPFRFTGVPPRLTPAEPPAEAAPAPAAPPPVAAPPVAADTAAPTPPPAAPQRPRLLGEPVPWPPRPDTTSVR